MSPRLLVFLLLPACAGPAAHRDPSSGSARNTSLPEAVRAQVATTLAFADPLAAPSCGLPTAPEVACPEARPPEKQDDPHQHHQHGAGAPVKPAPATPVVASTKVIDPVCKMTIDSSKAGGGSLWHDGQQHFFCSESCRSTFLSQHPGAK